MKAEVGGVKEVLVSLPRSSQVIREHSFLDCFLRVLNFRKFFIVWLVLILNSQIFVSAVNNPFSIKGFGELSYCAFFLFSVIYIIDGLLKGRAVKKSDCLIFMLPLVLMFYSALAASFTFGQPVWAGLLEERRMLSLYSFFPLIYFLRVERITPDELTAMLVWVGVFAAMLGLGLQLGLVSPIQALDKGELFLRQDRATVGNHFVALSFMIAVSALSYEKKSALFLHVIWILMLSALFFISQTRGVLIAAIMAVAIVSRDIKSALKKNAFYLVLVLASPLVLLPIISMTDQGQAMYQSFMLLFGGEYLSESVRTQSINNILNSFNLFGHGALWQQWNGGFSPIFGDYFFLADVGIFATMYRYGLLAVIVLLLMVLWLFKIWLLKRDDKNVLIAKSIAIYLVVMLPTAAIFENRGFILSIFLAYLVFYLENDRVAVKGSSGRGVSG